MVGVIGYSIGIAMTATFFEVTKSNLDLRLLRSVRSPRGRGGGAVRVMAAA
jgi:hypothetical protein